MNQAIEPKDPRTLFKPLFGWTYEPQNRADPHCLWNMGGDGRRRKNLLHADDFDQHPAWSLREDRSTWGDPMYDDGITEAYDDRVWICRIFCAYVTFRLRAHTYLCLADKNTTLEPISQEWARLDCRWTEVWHNLTRCLSYCLFAITDQERKAIFQLLLNTHLWCMKERQSCFRPEFALITSFRNSFLWAIPYRDIYRRVNHGLSELEELYERASVKEFLSVFYGHDRDDESYFANIEFEGWDPEKDGGFRIYAWDKDGDCTEPDYCSCTNIMMESPYVEHPNFSRVNLKMKERLYFELGVLLGREKLQTPKAGKNKRRK